MTTDGLRMLDPVKALDVVAVDQAVRRVNDVMAGRGADSPAPTPEGLKVGVDLGTASVVLTVLGPDDAPVAGAFRPAAVVRDGVVVDFVGAVDVLREMVLEVERRLGVRLPAAQGAFPPGVPRSEVRAVQHVIEGAGLDCAGLIDEPTAANAVLGLRDGVVVDVGGGTTGVAVIADAEVVHTADEATGGTHMSLVIAGAHDVTLDAAEAMKLDPRQQQRLLPVVRPVMEKVAAIVQSVTRGFPVPCLYLVGGPVGFPGFAEVVADYTGRNAVVPASPLFLTPLGIARSAPLLPVEGTHSRG